MFLGVWDLYLATWPNPGCVTKQTANEYLTPTEKWIGNISRNEEFKVIIQIFVIVDALNLVFLWLWTRSSEICLHQSNGNGMLHLLETNCKTFSKGRLYNNLQIPTSSSWKETILQNLFLIQVYAPEKYCVAQLSPSPSWSWDLALFPASPHPHPTTPPGKVIKAPQL